MDRAGPAAGGARTVLEERPRHHDDRRDRRAGRRVASNVLPLLPHQGVGALRREYGWFQSFTEHFLAQPTKLSDIEAARATLLELAPVLVRIRKALRQYEQAVASSPTLRGGVATGQAEDITRMANAIVARRGLKEPDEACLLLANVVLATYRRALFRWLVS